MQGGYQNEDAILEEELKERLQKKVRRRSVLMFLVGTAVVLAVLAALSLLVMKLFFSVKEIELKGDPGWTVEELLEASSIKKGDLMLFIDRKNAENAILKKYGMIESVSVTRDLPDKLVFTVKTERPLFFCIDKAFSMDRAQEDECVVISESEKVIDILPQNEARHKYGLLPTVKMPETEYAVLGERIRYREAGDAGYIPALIATVRASFFDGTDLVFDLHARFDIVIYSGIAEDGLPKYEIRLGNYRRYEEKISLAESIAKNKLDPRFKGLISVETSGDEPVKEAYARAR